MDIEKLTLLKRACDLIVSDPHLKSELDEKGNITKTFCNVGVRLICEALGLSLWPPNMLANDMHDLMVENPSWVKCEGFEASLHAKSGKIAIASRKGDGHGHVCVVYPGDLVESPSLAKLVPLVANVGAKVNGVVAVSKAFAVKDGEPSYFKYVGPSGHTG